MNPDDTNQGNTGGAMPAGEPQVAETCATCGGTSANGNCVSCGQPNAACTCPPAAPSGGGEPSGGMGGGMPEEPAGGGGDPAPAV